MFSKDYKIRWQNSPRVIKSPPKEEQKVPESRQKHRSAQDQKEVGDTIIHRPPAPAQLPTATPEPARQSNNIEHTHTSCRNP